MSDAPAIKLRKVAAVIPFGSSSSGSYRRKKLSAAIYRSITAKKDLSFQPALVNLTEIK